ncbi:MAG TPA: DUF2510 domain-containing protein [Acidimicrobiales bacterium]|nr:DUF2510 domain-containing protein [Acidimicrobiales bacterium]
MLYYGHGSWIALVIFFAFFALRMFSRTRRRRASGPAPAPMSSFTDAPPSGLTGDRPDGHPRSPHFVGIAPGWLTDPSGRHQQRYWSGSEWTDQVTDDGVPGTDPPPDGLRRETTS